MSRYEEDAMLTIEAEARVTDGQLIVPVSPTLLPGSYRVVVVIDAPVPDVDVTVLTPDEARAALARLREDFRAQGPTTPTMGEQLEADRRARDRTQLGKAARDEDGDVHP